MRRHLLPLILLVPALLAACDEGFAPKSEINKLRILAIDASSPTIEPGDSTRLSALVVSPDDRPFTIEWQVCLFTSGANDLFECPEDDDPNTPANTLTSGTGESIDFTYDPELQFVFQFLCEQQAEIRDQIPEGFPLPTCNLGYPLRVRIPVTDETTDESIVAIKTLYADHKPTSGRAVEKNQNPTVLGLSLDEREGPVDAVVGAEVPVFCEVDPDSLERYTPPGEGEEERDEEILFSWFTTVGSVEEDLTLFSELGRDLTEAGENTLDLSDVEPGEAVVWCVIRDGRGGTDWAEHRFTVRAEGSSDTEP